LSRQENPEGRTSYGDAQDPKESLELRVGEKGQIVREKRKVQVRKEEKSTAGFFKGILTKKIKGGKKKKKPKGGEEGRRSGPVAKASASLAN